ncbi:MULTISPECIES: hypothetical protein [Methylobacterium]|jgi:hypothetical protein|uniref:Uncharacterized protein n=2 Tax=Methylobacterium TaxID=407 RepID=A0A0C6FZH5_9HYPH|nr:MULTISPECIES: hypothetical protein [Methylobacterium]MBZ6413565.1 hypothetical protein [Methylobacterium sp.]MBK3395979.1 hypothetical protein [Methylobacterium ajmalii]MBK3409712.1 hypothetical protein [Methylobacterium ajmalii]MBK3425137.1 hypothetical protein [Methylobacterium ajmalii]SFF37291.1 hypothetical protein SAMN04487844_116103 [Methylobacterium sp. yr596]
MTTPTTEITLERIALIRRLVVAWDPAGQGAPAIHPDAPYGSLDRDGDIANVTGDDEGAAEEHRAVGAALVAFLRHAELKPGRYGYHNPLTKLDLTHVSDVFRDESAGTSPEQIVFEVGPEHLALIRHLALGWDEARGVPAVDADAPYGPGTLDDAMVRALGGPRDDLARLHRAMQPALQIFLRSADIAPGDYA